MPERTVKPMAIPKKELPAWGLVVAVWSTTKSSRKVQNHSTMTAPMRGMLAPGVMRKVSERMAHWNRPARNAAKIWTTM